MANYREYLRLLLFFSLAWALPVQVSADIDQPQPALRFATFNVSLYGENSGEVAQRIAGGKDPQAQALAEIIQRVQPDVLLLNEIDYTPDDRLLKVFLKEYLGKPQNKSGSPDGPAKPVEFPYHFTAPSNTGVHSGRDLDHNGIIDSRPGSRDYGGDCWGFGVYEGQYGMAVLSRFPIDEGKARTFRKFLWRDLPHAQLPTEPQRATSPQGLVESWYSLASLAQFRLSSKSHWDVPVKINGQRVHLLASHPTPPGFDGPEDRNGRRNQDEIRFWTDYLAAGKEYHIDDRGTKGGLKAGERFVIAGDLNADPADGAANQAIRNLLASPRVAQADAPSSVGAVEQSERQGGVNVQHTGNPKHDTLDASDNANKGGPGRNPGNLRVDYVLPSVGFRITGSGVFWPETSDPLFKLVGVHPFPSSDHRLVWVDVEFE
ncbi:endonuclease/exonuclease/phosphatase family protein [Adhaeretor mobilis]|uniref:Endonuclease/Exonuclease/phosphatase family protein n=1 Tax=Adhaeretor mobilis TaxID=1930276 RepID=A0A517N138_9BACT|nr:endonuclease/exonuclease/phosphatase family protein [Adhaeretor mobilis]QDT00851.1 Endonuclease/Exonuclease/phosphatase family protein [Adhaeretor mobilis]